MALGIAAAALALVAWLAIATAPGAPASAAAQAAPEPGATPDAAAASSPSLAAGPRAGASSLKRPGLRRQLRQAISSAGGNSGAWVFDTGSNRPVLFARTARNRRILASNQKLFTTAAVLGRFGADHRFKTAVHERGPRVGKRDQILRGNLVLRGDGDPALGTAAFANRHGLPLTRIWALAGAIKRSGLRTVRGRVLADDSIFDRRRGIAATGWRPGPYLSPLSGLSYNSGYGPRGYAPSPELVAARTLRKALRANGIRVVRNGIGRTSLPRRAGARKPPVARVSSPTVARLAAATNKPSNNFFAEMLLKRLGGGTQRKGTTTRGARRVQKAARKLGTRVRAVDGSGLGRSNRASPKQVGKLLRAMDRGPSALAFRRSLSIAGRDGTLAGRMRGTAAQGRCRGKTGTLSGVSALSGYCNRGGKRIVFSILMNGVDVTRARSAQDRMVTAIARYRR